jgi:hypothetical protein
MSSRSSSSSQSSSAQQEGGASRNEADVDPDVDAGDLYIDEAMFAMLRERREEALKHISDYNPFVNRTTKTSLLEKVKVRPVSVSSPLAFFDVNLGATSL